MSHVAEELSILIYLFLNHDNKYIQLGSEVLVLALGGKMGGCYVRFYGPMLLFFINKNHKDRFFFGGGDSVLARDEDS
ncbi:hypothetical protein [Aeromonas cavernicola]|uniref:Uncharacterized protein n=1 Tax=Aeromonas cavernicola TaxID=1006623 RepID=A0A2H9U7B3_9GAMM|nr:hypothetical protein [Aeromonas cavernicola]PJG59925.1 hypothetical protein CUC53_04680 [Aeromonas cavernicola]